MTRIDVTCPGARTRDPYAIWVSEIMLQQTRVEAVSSLTTSVSSRVFRRCRAGRGADRDVLAPWSGLGYYRRARSSMPRARVVAQEHPAAPSRAADELRMLPGIGPTPLARSPASRSSSAPIVDGNVARVLSRLRGWESTDSAGKAAVRRNLEKFVSTLVDPSRPGDFNQALMELGATVCTPRGPQCLNCPWIADCSTKGEHRTPRRPPMTSREVACALVLRSAETNAPNMLLEQRPPSETVMANMWQLPFLRDVEVPDRDLRMTVRHAIMQVNYIVRVRNVAEDKLDALAEKVHYRRWVSPAEAGKMALTGLTRKVLSRAALLPAVSRLRLQGSKSST